MSDEDLNRLGEVLCALGIHTEEVPLGGKLVQVVNEVPVRWVSYIVNVMDQNSIM